MDDIGMDSDYRSGVSESVECHVCERTGPDELATICSECRRPACPDCHDTYMDEPVCDMCAIEKGWL
ncbi:MAG: hypothetical protein GWN58_19530 [Anaerolineae bacterium]|nr:hypothetical protein [Anaerolineae bacterium]